MIHMIHSFFFNMDKTGQRRIGLNQFNVTAETKLHFFAQWLISFKV